MLNSLSRFQTNLPDTMQRLTQIASEFLQNIESRFPLAKRAGLSAGLQARIDFFAQGRATQFAGDAALFGFKWLPSLLLVPFLTFFFLRDGTAFHQMILRAVPNAFFEKTLLLFDRMNRQMHAYFRGMFWLTVLDTVSLGIGLWLLGLGMGIFTLWQALLLGLVCAVFAWVPYLGTAVGGVGGGLCLRAPSPASSPVAPGGRASFLRGSPVGRVCLHARDGGPGSPCAPLGHGDDDFCRWNVGRGLRTVACPSSFGNFHRVGADVRGNLV